jgi:hypothetical protein
MAFLEVCAENVDFCASLGRSVFRIDIVQLGGFVPIVRHVIIGVVLVIESNIQFSHVLGRRRSRANSSGGANDSHLSLANAFELAECIILVHSVSLLVLKFISVLVIKHAELRAKLNEGVKA